MLQRLCIRQRRRPNRNGGRLGRRVCGILGGMRLNTGEQVFDVDGRFRRRRGLVLLFFALSGKHHREHNHAGNSDNQTACQQNGRQLGLERMKKRAQTACCFDVILCRRLGAVLRVAFVFAVRQRLPAHDCLRCLVACGAHAQRQLRNQGVHIGRAVGGMHGESVHQRLFLTGANVRPQLRGKGERIVYIAFECRYGHLSGNAIIDRRTERIHIGKGSLLAVAEILLLRRIALFENNRFGAVLA